MPDLMAKTSGGESKASVIMDVRIRASKARMGRVRVVKAVGYSGEDVETAESSTKNHNPPETWRILEGERAREMGVREPAAKVVGSQS